MLAYKLLDLLRLPCVITKGNSHKSFHSTNQKVHSEKLDLGIWVHLPKNIKH